VPCDAKRVRESANVVQAVGGKIAVVDEKDVHAGGKNLKRVENESNGWPDTTLKTVTKKGRPATLRGSAWKVNADFAGREAGFTPAVRN
jgi:hypothetical protein